MSKHYKHKFIEHWDFMETYSEAIKETPYIKHLWCLGNITKYAFRAPFKGNFYKDMQKIIVYAEKILKSGEYDADYQDKNIYNKLFLNKQKDESKL